MVVFVETTESFLQNRLKYALTFLGFNFVQNTPLHMAAEVGQMSAVTLLMAADAKFSLNIDGNLFFDLAIDNKHGEVASAVVKHDR